MRTYLTLSLLIVTGCYDKVQFTEDYNSVNCDRTFECYPEEQQILLSYETATACKAYWADEPAPEIGEGCAFDGGVAESCVEELAAMSCETFIAGELPESCYAYITCD